MIYIPPEFELDAASSYLNPAFISIKNEFRVTGL